MTTDLEEFAGIIAATAEDAMPRVVRTFEYLGHTVSIIEPTMGGDDRDEIRRGYLWHAVIGDFDLEPTRPGYHDPDRWVPGVARLRPGTGAELLSFSTVSPAAVATSARRILRKRAGAR
jgi:hypothetical protein